ncbi:unnamed protein product [Linum trigynum]|uniref:Uncharacterized protein n=1 Tax=Linum trigynum TaxID=586398 RepID=A0AAV2EC77_9ROSI
MTRKSPTVENRQSLAKSDEEDEDKDKSSSYRSSHSEIHSLGALKLVPFFWRHHLAGMDNEFLRLERTSHFGMFSPKVTELEAEDDAEHKVIVGRRRFTPIGEYPYEEGKNLDFDAEITLLNEKNKTADNRVVGQVRDSVWMKFIRVNEWKL